MSKYGELNVGHQLTLRTTNPVKLDILLVNTSTLKLIFKYGVQNKIFEVSHLFFGLSKKSL